MAKEHYTITGSMYIIAWSRIGVNICSIVVITISIFGIGLLSMVHQKLTSPSALGILSQLAVYSLKSGLIVGETSNFQLRLLWRQWLSGNQRTGGKGRVKINYTVPNLTQRLSLNLSFELFPDHVLLRDSPNCNWDVLISANNVRVRKQISGWGCTCRTYDL